MPVPGGHPAHDLPRILRGLGAVVVVVLAPMRPEIAVFKPGVAERARVDGGERPLPDRLLARERRVGMTGYGDCIGKARERLGDSAVVVAPEPRAVAGILGRRVLEVEERLRGVDRPSVLPEPFRRLRHAGFIEPPALVCNPVRPDERIAPDILAPDRRILLAERLLPRGREIGADRVRGIVLAQDLFPSVAVPEPLPVVVAVDEKTLDAPSVRRPVARKHRTPDPSHLLKLLHKAAVRHVAADRDAVDTLVAKPFKRPAELV